MSAFQKTDHQVNEYLGVRNGNSILSYIATCLGHALLPHLRTSIMLVIHGCEIYDALLLILLHASMHAVTHYCQVNTLDHIN